MFGKNSFAKKLLYFAQQKVALADKRIVPAVQGYGDKIVSFLMILFEVYRSDYGQYIIVFDEELYLDPIEINKGP